MFGLCNLFLKTFISLLICLSINITPLVATIVIVISDLNAICIEQSLHDARETRFSLRHTSANEAACLYNACKLVNGGFDQVTSFYFELLKNCTTV